MATAFSDVGLWVGDRLGILVDAASEKEDKMSKDEDDVDVSGDAVLVLAAILTPHK